MEHPDVGDVLMGQAADAVATVEVAGVSSGGPSSAVASPSLNRFLLLPLSVVGLPRMYCMSYVAARLFFGYIAYGSLGRAKLDTLNTNAVFWDERPFLSQMSSRSQRRSR